jgi:hypothetical protein
VKTYYLSLECEVCDHTIYYGPCGTLLEHNGYPVVPLDVATQERLDCDNCGAMHYVSELDVYVEGGDAPDENENENEDEDD